MIHHRPRLNIKRVLALYEEKDGVPIKYVCTSAMRNESVAGDIFFRKKPHPQFGNRYFMLRSDPMTGMLMISNADAIEQVEFFMVKGTNGWEYSQHRHDFHHVEGAGVSLDGGRAYFRLVGSVSPTLKQRTYTIKDGKFVWDRKNTSKKSCWASWLKTRLRNMLSGTSSPSSTSNA